MSLSCQNEIVQFKESLVSLKPYTYFIKNYVCEKDVNKTKWEQSSTLLRGGPFQIAKLFKMNMTSYKIFVLKNSYAIKLEVTLKTVQLNYFKNPSNCSLF